MMENKYIKALKYFHGELSREEAAAFESWSEEDDANKAFLDEVRTAWNASAGYKTAEFDIESALAEMPFSKTNGVGRSTQSADKQKDVAPKRNRRYLKVGMSIAAGAAILITAWFLVFGGTSSSYDYFAAENSEIGFDDGTVLYALAGTKMTLPESFASGQRRIKLHEGEIFLDVAEDPSRPFIVDGPEADVRVLGTRFGVTINPSDGTEVLVDEGKVRLTPDGSDRHVDITKGQGASYRVQDDGSGVLQRIEDPDLNEIARYTGRLVFDGVSLEEILAVLETTYDVSFDVTQCRAIQCPLTTSYDDEPLTNILSEIEVVLEVKCHSKGDNFYVVTGGRSSCED